jgi:transposase
MTKRRNHSASFKSKVALEAISGELTLAELATKHSVHQTQITKWKRQLLDGVADIFSGTADNKAASHEDEIKELHAKIGQLTVEKDFLERVSVRLGVSGGKK